MKKILFIHQKRFSFSQRDLDLLKEKYIVREILYSGISDVGKIIKGTLWCDIVFCWFAKLHAAVGIFSAKLFRKHSVVIAGGDDVAYVPEINYGMACYWWKKWCPALVFRLVDKIVPVSQFSLKELEQFFRVAPRKVCLLYHGFEPGQYKRDSTISKENIVITVGKINSETSIKKGLAFFVHCARGLPETPFYLIGPDQDGTGKMLERSAPPNVTFTGGVYGDKLLEYFNRSKVYVQLSKHESFGCSLAEAMLCEAIPVVTKNAALPEVVGDVGYAVDNTEVGTAVKSIKQALQAPDEKGKKARERIETHFSIEKRREGLFNILDFGLK